MKEFLTYTELCSEILGCPTNFMSNPSLFKIGCFVNGYSFARKDRFPDREVYQKFNWWVADRFAVKTSHNWESIIYFEAGSDSSSLDLANELWQEYLRTAERSLDASREISFDAGDHNSIKTSELFEMLQQRPALYIGHESVIGIKSFLDGYEFALGSAGIEHRDSLYSEFSPWIAKRFNKSFSRRWDEIISFMALSEIGAFELMTVLWEEYKAMCQKLQTEARN